MVYSLGNKDTTADFTAAGAPPPAAIRSAMATTRARILVRN